MLRAMAGKLAKKLRAMAGKLTSQYQIFDLICSARKAAQKCFAFLVRALVSKTYALNHRICLYSKLEYGFRYAGT